MELILEFRSNFWNEDLLIKYFLLLIYIWWRLALEPHVFWCLSDLIIFYFTKQQVYRLISIVSDLLVIINATREAGSLALTLSSMKVLV